MSAIHQARWTANIDVRRLLAALLCQPDWEVLAEESVVPRLVAALKGLLPGNTDGMDVFLTALDKEDQGTLLTEYTRLFIGPDRLPAAPYGSVYLAPGRQVFAETTEEVRLLYAEEGLALAEGLHEPPDHVALEFEFAAFLLEKAAQAWLRGDLEEAERLLAKARHFESKLLRSWLPTLAASIEAAAETSFYRGVARSLVLYCDSEMPTLPGSAGSGEEQGS
jgi:TorA maturation chaperone TorD